MTPRARHEIALPGPAAGCAASIGAAEPLGATRGADFDGAQVWVHRNVAQTDVSARVETEERREEDAFKTSKRGD